MPKVYIVNKGNHPAYNLAIDFGELVEVTQGRINVFAIDNLKSYIKEKLKDISSDDYVLTSGYIVPNAMVIHEFLKRFNLCKLLLWDAVKQKYIQVTLTD